MEIKLTEVNGFHIAELISDEKIITNSQQAVDLIMNCAYQGAKSLLIREENLSASFFDLKTGLAGEILQKFSTYRMRLAIVGDFGKYPGKSLRDFIRESNKAGRICFTETHLQAIEALSRGQN